MDKLTIVGLEGGTSGVAVEVQFNPKEISVDKSVPWKRHNSNEGGGLEFTAAEPRTMSFELMFDGVESGAPIQDRIDTLQRLSEVDGRLGRPPRVKVVWGSERGAGRIPPFDAVIESIGVTYTMFDADGMPLRATVRMGFIEALKLRAVAQRTVAKRAQRSARARR